MLKQHPTFAFRSKFQSAAFGRLCVETMSVEEATGILAAQPPSGGCVLKPFWRTRLEQRQSSAAFGRLCVETLLK